MSAADVGKTLASAAGRIGDDITAELLYHKLLAPMLEKLGKNGQEVLTEKIQTILAPSQDDIRVDMLNRIRIELKHTNRKAYANFVRRYAAAKADPNPLAEDSFVKVFCLMYQNTGETPEGQDSDPEKSSKQLIAIKDLCLEDDAIFDLFMDAYRNDPAWKALKWIGRQIKEGVDIADKWLRGIIAYIATWPMVLMLSSAAGASQGRMWFIAALPMIAILALIVSKKVSPTYVILGSWADQKLKLNLRSTAASIMGLHVVFGVYLGFYPIQSLDLIFLLYIASIALFFLGMGKGSLVGFGKLACYGLVIFALYANHNGITSTDTPQIEAAADTVITKVKGAVGMGPGSSKENAILISASSPTDPIEIPAGSAGWFEIEPNEWTQWVTCPYGYRFNLISLTNRVQVKCYVNPPGDGPSQEVIRVAGPGEPLDWPLHVTKLSFYAEKTVWTNIGVLKNKTR